MKNGSDNGPAARDDPARAARRPRLAAGALFAGGVLGIAAVYFGTAKLGLQLAFVSKQVTAVWPPTGIALAALLVCGLRFWPGVALGAFLANVTAEEPAITALGIATGNTLEALTGVWLLQRLAGFDPSFQRLKDVLAFVVLAAVCAPTVSATLGVTSLCLSGLQPREAFGSLWWLWWLGDATGALLVAPVLLTWSNRPARRWPGRRVAEGTALVASLAVAALVVFGGRLDTAASHHPLEYMIFPFIIWAALRFGQPGTTLVTFVAAGLAVLGTVSGFGPFAGGTVHESLILLQAFLGVVAVTALFLSAAIAERATAEQRRAADFAVTQVLAESAGLGEAIPRILDVICETCAWDLGGFWSVDREAGVLRCVEVRHRPTVQAGAFAALSRRSVFASGVGLPGRVWCTGGPVWIPDLTDDKNFPRRSAAAAAGLHGAIGFPVRLGQDVLGVIEFFSREIRRPDRDLLRMFATVGSQIGQFLDRRRAEEALRQSEERFRVALQGSPVVVFSQDQDLRHTWVYNPHAGVPPAAMLGKTDEELNEPATAQRVTALKRSVLESGVGARREVEMDIRGQRHFYDVRLEPLHDASGRVVGLTGAAADVTEHKRLQEQLLRRAAQLAEADQRKDEFLAMLAHELRNPLAPIRNALEVLKMPGADEATVGRARAILERQLQHLVRLVDDLLDVSRINRGKIQLRKEPVHLATVVARAVETARPVIDAQGHELTVDLPPEPVLLEADLTRLAQVFANLLNNAAKYTEQAGRIWIAAGQEGPEAVIRVRDTGIGIRADLLPGVFDLFVQGDRSLDRSQGGLGIGLTLVRSLVELHGGTVTASSAGEGQGSEFVVRLPVLPGPPPPDAQPAEGRGQAAAPPRRVLVVDDNVDAAESLAILLRLAGHEVHVAHNGPAALAAAAAYRPDLVLLDIGLPGMDGYEVAQRLRRQRDFIPAVLVAVTGYGQEEDRRRSREAGFDLHLVKPVEPDAVEAVLANAALRPPGDATAPPPPS